MKKIFAMSLLALISSMAWSQAATVAVYKSECKVREDIKMDGEGVRGFSEAEQRHIEISGNEVVLTKTFFADELCNRPIRKHLNLGTLENGAAANVRIMKFSKSYIVRIGEQLTYRILRQFGVFAIDKEQQEALPAVVKNAAAGLENVFFYEKRGFEAQFTGRGANVNPLTTLIFDEAAQTILYLNKPLVLQK